jgi:hypothetical protein
MASRWHAKGAAVGPTDSMVTAAAVPVRNPPLEEPLPASETTVIHTNTGTTQGNSIPTSWCVDSNTIVIGTSSPTPGTGNSGTVQVTARLVEEDNPGSAYVVLPNTLQQCLLTPGGRRLCFGIVVVLLVLGALGAVALAFAFAFGSKDTGTPSNICSTNHQRTNNTDANTDHPSKPNNTDANTAHCSPLKTQQLLHQRPKSQQHKCQLVCPPLKIQ